MVAASKLGLPAVERSHRANVERFRATFATPGQRCDQRPNTMRSVRCAIAPITTHGSAAGHGSSSNEKGEHVPEKDAVPAVSLGRRREINQCASVGKLVHIRKKDPVSHGGSPLMSAASGTPHDATPTTYGRERPGYADRCSATPSTSLSGALAGVGVRRTARISAVIARSRTKNNRIAVVAR